MTIRVITVETSCGRTFRTPVNEMTDTQLITLLKENSERTDLDPGDLGDLSAMRDELERRRRSNKGRCGILTNSSGVIVGSYRNIPEWLVDTLTDAASRELTPHEKRLVNARMRGAEAREAGKSKADLPEEYRTLDRAAEAAAWHESFDSGVPF
jgi:hypothetical protein